MKSIWKSYLKLTKSGIITFVLLTAAAGYFISLRQWEDFNPIGLTLFLSYLYLVAAGNFILNQAQECNLDKKMPRTQTRPIPLKQITATQAYGFSAVFVALGLIGLYILQPMSAYLAALICILYNGFYTLIWKRKFFHGAVLGAVPGALPPVIGASFAGNHILNLESVYLFLILFLWQMPHFWILAVRYKDDYQKGGVPVLPVACGFEKTAYEIGLYLVAYVGLIFISPLFLRVGILYLVLAIPLGFKLFLEFFRYINDSKKWLSFFIWINLSLLVSIGVPIIDKWFFYFLALS